MYEIYQEENMKYLESTTLFENLDEIVDPEHTALVVWHAQNAMINTTFNKPVLVKKLSSFIAAARRTKVPIVYARTTPYPRQFESGWKIYMHMKETGVEDPARLPQVFADPASQPSQIYPELSPQENDVVLSTYTGSIFIGTFFENLMRNREIKTILFTGVATEMGIESSARDSRNRGFYTVVVEDCVSSSEEKFHQAALTTLRRVVIVEPSTALLKSWKK
jgi:nicotinamidase-related amidase